MNGAADR